MMPISTEDTSLTTGGFCLFYVPIYEIFTILVMYFTIAFKAKVYVCKNSRFFKQLIISVIVIVLYNIIVYINTFVKTIISYFGEILRVFAQLPIVLDFVL